MAGPKQLLRPTFKLNRTFGPSGRSGGGVGDLASLKRLCPALWPSACAALAAAAAAACCSDSLSESVSRFGPFNPTAVHMAWLSWRFARARQIQCRGWGLGDLEQKKFPGFLVGAIIEHLDHHIRILIKCRPFLHIRGEMRKSRKALALIHIETSSRRVRRSPSLAGSARDQPASLGRTRRCWCVLGTKERREGGGS